MKMPVSCRCNRSSPRTNPCFIEQYPIVGEYLLQAIKDVLGDAAAEEVVMAGTEAYQALAGVFINREQLQLFICLV